MRRTLVLLGAVLLPAVFAQAQFKSDYETEQAERNWREGGFQLPAYPKTENLIEFFVSSASDFRFYVDRASLSVGKDGVVRYTLVAHSPAGAENVSFEGIRCKSGIYRIYATGHRDGTWSTRPSDWRPIEAKSVARWHSALRREFFCPNDIPIFTAAEGVDALQRGGHPDAGSTQFR